MSIYGKIDKNGNFQQAPVNYISRDGSPILNFCSSEKLLAEYGFKPVEQDVMPEIDEGYVAIPVYTDNGTVIHKGWKVKLLEEE